jgi:hypothetical protein
MTIYVGDPNGLARQVDRVHVGIDGVAEAVTKVYVGDSNNVARQVYEYVIVPVSIPTMTSNTLPSGVASASNVYQESNTYQAFRAFDKNTGTYWSSKIWNTSHDMRVTYDFGFLVRPNEVYVKNGSENSSAFRKFYIEGSADNAAWDILVDQSSNTTAVDTTYPVTTANNYRYFRYRCAVTSSSTGNGRVLVYEFDVRGFKI